VRQSKRNIPREVIPEFKRNFTLFIVLSSCVLIILSSHYSTDPHSLQVNPEHFEINPRISLDNRLNITNPKQGDTISGVITITWNVEGSLVDGSTSYQVHYSPDNGSNWIILAVYILNPNHVWNTTLYEEHNTQCRIRISFQSKNFEDFQVVSESFAIDNRISADPIDPVNPIDLSPYFLILGSIIVLGGGIWKYRPIIQQKSILQIIQSEKHEWLTTLSHKIIIGLDNIKSEFIDELPLVADVKTVSLSSSIAEIFPLDLRHDLQHNMKGRTVLTLIEMAYLGPHDTTLTKISKSLEIPLPTLSKEIKKLEIAGYVETYLTTQMLQDARFKNFTITKKGFELLLNLDTVLKIAIDRMK
jgi:DNA-binding MarR family transcriptional regulator